MEDNLFVCAQGGTSYVVKGRRVPEWVEGHIVRVVSTDGEALRPGELEIVFPSRFWKINNWDPGGVR